MDFAAYQQEILDDISAETTDAFYTTAVIKRAINRAVRYVAGYRPWSQTEMAYYNNAVAGNEYYNYPETFKPDSLSKLTYQGVEHTKVNFRDYTRYQEEGGVNATDKVFSDFRRQYFISPTPTADEAQAIVIWGQEIPPTLVNASDQDPFYGDPEMQEIVIKYALGLLYKKGRGTIYDRGVALQAEAIQDMSMAWSKQVRRNADYNPKDSVIFKPITILPQSNGGRRTERGTFRTY